MPATAAAAHQADDASVGAAPPALGDALVLTATASVVLLPIGCLARCGRRACRARRRRLDLLALVGQRAPEYGTTIVEHGVPAVYCLSGRGARVVVTRGALDVLSETQLRAVLEHERAHIVGRHHLLRVLAEAFSRTFRGLPLGRHAKERTFLLLEMIADDRALRFHPGEVPTTAMHEVAAGRAPLAALGASGSGVAIRLRRVLTPQPRAATRGVVGNRGGSRRFSAVASAGGVRALTPAGPAPSPRVVHVAQRDYLTPEAPVRLPVERRGAWRTNRSSRL
ncbi:M56 family metallopeptidase [Streptomyces sp. NPDC001634]|uniref:M56 family metallopeptidase n=1 Tax=Streptomyces sp. NPDC001634 TaxID=3154390 RepID=UPI00332E46FB